MHIQLDDESRTVKFSALEPDADLRRIQRRKASVVRRRAVYRQTLDDIDQENLPMPAITSLKARSQKRDAKFKKKGPAMSQLQKERTKVSLQKMRHMSRSCANHARETDTDFCASNQDAFVLA